MSRDIDSLDNKPTEGGDMPQRRLGKYELLRSLGRGGMGEVWLARDTLADVEVALKMLPPELRYSEEAQDQIRTSYQRVYKLGHPNICGVKDLVTDPGLGYFLVMDYFDGITLSKYRSEYVSRHSKLPLQEAIRLLAPVALALDYAHGVGLAHRDVKPGNILVSRDGKQVRVIDFQLAAEIRSSVSRYSKLQYDTSGTYPYMAPEQFGGKRANALTDLYSLSMVLYELLAGELPYEPHGWDQWKGLVTDEKVKIPAIHGLSERVQSAVVKGLSLAPENRFPSCVKFLIAVKAAAQPDQSTGSRANANESKPSPAPSPQTKPPLSRKQTDTARPSITDYASVAYRTVVEHIKTFLSQQAAKRSLRVEAPPSTTTGSVTSSPLLVAMKQYLRAHWEAVAVLCVVVTAIFVIVKLVSTQPVSIVNDVIVPPRPDQVEEHREASMLKTVKITRLVAVTEQREEAYDVKIGNVTETRTRTVPIHRRVPMTLEIVYGGELALSNTRNMDDHEVADVAWTSPDGIHSTIESVVLPIQSSTIWDGSHPPLTPITTPAPVNAPEPPM